MPKLYTPKIHPNTYIALTPKEGGTLFLRVGSIHTAMALPPHIARDSNDENVVVDGTRLLVQTDGGALSQYAVRDDAAELLELIAEEVKDE